MKTRTHRARRSHHAARRIALALSLLLILATTGTAFAATTYADVPETASWKASVDRLSLLGILSGTTSGQLLPDAAVTREQFAKMAVTAANEATDDQIRRNSTGFPDVSASRWSSGYVRTAVSLGFFTGYPDGRFHPADPVTYAQALTISLRMLGYDTASLTGTWPQSVLAKAATLKLTTGFTYGANSPMTRKDVAILLGRLLETKTASASGGTSASSGGSSGTSGTTAVTTGASGTGSASTAATAGASGTGSASSATASGSSGTASSGGVPYAQSTGLYRTVLVLSDPSLDTTLDEGEVRTDIGTLNNTTVTALAIGHDYLVKLDGTDIAKVYGPASYTLSYTVSALSDSTLYYGTGAGTQSLVLTADQKFYDNDGAISYGTVFSEIQAGSGVTLAWNSADLSLSYVHFSTPAIARTGTYTDLLVLDTAATSTDLPANRILTDRGTFTLAAGVAVPAPGTRIGAVLNGSVVTSVSGQTNRTERATVIQVSGTDVVQIREGTRETVSLPLSATWYHDGAKVAAAQLPSLLARNSSIVYGMDPSGEGADYALLYDPVFSDPQIADSQEIYDGTLGSIALAGATLSRSGDLIAVYEIKYNDVAYEVTDIWGGNRYVELYTSQVIGVVDAYAPNRFAPASLTLSVYNDATRRSEAKTYAFSDEFPVETLAGDKFQVGESAIVLLGRDGKIVRMLP